MTNLKLFRRYDYDKLWISKEKFILILFAINTCDKIVSNYMAKGLLFLYKDQTAISGPACINA